MCCSLGRLLFKAVWCALQRLTPATAKLWPAAEKQGVQRLQGRAQRSQAQLESIAYDSAGALGSGALGSAGAHAAEGTLLLLNVRPQVGWEGALKRWVLC